ENANLAQPGGLFVQAPKGLVYAFRDGDDVRLRRIEANIDRVDPTALVYRSGTNAIPIRIPVTPFQPDETALGSLQRLTTSSKMDQIVADGPLGSYVLLSMPEQSSNLPPLAFYGRPIAIPPSAIPVPRAGDVVSGSGGIIYALVSTGIAVLRVQGETVSTIGAPNSGLVFDAALGPRIAAVPAGTTDRVLV